MSVLGVDSQGNEHVDDAFSVAAISSPEQSKGRATIKVLSPADVLDTLASEFLRLYFGREES